MEAFFMQEYNYVLENLRNKFISLLGLQGGLKVT